jgi:16S rRNA (guanine966-N2)-methyltransferase
MQVRPTSDRLRETLFNVIAPRIVDSRFLDLCAGSGAVGIEALSRGASHTTFVDRSRKICALIEANINLCRIPDEQAEIYNNDVDDFLRQAQSWKMSRWDVIFFDPPYKEDYLRVVQAIDESWETLLNEKGLLIVEHHHKTDLPDELAHIRRVRVLKQGDSSLSFYERQSP